MSLSIYGIDLAKHSFSIHGEDSVGNMLIHKTITRSKVLTTFVNIPPAIVGMEACGASHYWACELTKLGHTAKIMAAKNARIIWSLLRHDTDYEPIKN
jgi:transposase